MSTHFAHHPVSVGLLLFPTVEELDFAGPYEVFANACEERGQAYCQVMTIGTAQEIRCRGGLRVFLEQWFGVEARKSAAKRLDGPWH